MRQWKKRSEDTQIPVSDENLSIDDTSSQLDSTRSGRISIESNVDDEDEDNRVERESKPWLDQSDNRHGKTGNNGIHEDAENEDEDSDGDGNEDNQKDDTGYNVADGNEDDTAEDDDSDDADDIDDDEEDSDEDEDDDDDDSKESSDKPKSKIASVCAFLFVIALIAAPFVLPHLGGHSASSSSASDDKAFEESVRKSHILNKANDTFTADIQKPQDQLGNALYIITQSSGMNGPADTIEQDDLDDLKAATATVANSGSKFTKTQAYRDYGNIRKAYQAYQAKNKKYVNVLNNFSDSVVGYTATIKTCQEDAQKYTNLNDDPDSVNTIQTIITNCETSAQSVTASKDPFIKAYANASLKRMGKAQKLLEQIKALGSRDEIMNNPEKSQKYWTIEDKIRIYLYETKEYGDGNPVYKELDDAKPSKEMKDLYTTIYTIK
ncbi:hypothetical protein [Bifidobacterium sp. ESL0764]|uniref:hypothetical protein n=1 Tax=Bifidobacterium sp. ESL0764 TaxID=2983228 RepID=UPI0023F97B90|nr:hypothetical protein [Bifidobacterium sp. ESL0764]WEV66082.1 hypothetical protein OZX71_01630 [Bifidobacterium sp. ESL0764]